MADRWCVDDGVELKVTDGQRDRCTDVSFALLPVLKVSEVVVIRKDCPAQKIVALGLRVYS